MEGARKASLPLIGDSGETVGRLLIHLLPGTKEDGTPPPLLDLQDVADRRAATEPVQVLEGCEYRYVVDVSQPGPISVRPVELFHPDSEEGRQGRLRAGLHTGFLPVEVALAGVRLGRTGLEVRSSKLGYLDDYQWMMEDLAELFAGLVAERFAPSQQRFQADLTRDTGTLYQQFAFLHSLLASEVFDAAIHQVLARPHRTWVTEEERRPPGRPAAPSSSIARQLSRPGPRVPAERFPGKTAPLRIQAERPEETLDTAENRFVKFALLHWRSLCLQIHEALTASQRTAPVQRGLQETAELSERLDGWLAADLFREVGTMTQLPFASQVLQKRAGYREVFRAYVLSEAGAALAWQGGEDVYRAGQRNVATLYEFWVFVQLARTITHLCHEPFQWERLLVQRENGMSVGLRRGSGRRLKGTVHLLGRHLRLELWYNRSFRPGAKGAATWIGQMAPDYSLRIRLAGKDYLQGEDVWIHFDAKYRVEQLVGLSAPQAPEDEDAADWTPATRAKREDLLKMHAYRDAIRRTAGAYVIYPGEASFTQPVYHEILPGLGAFALRPTETGEAAGAEAIRRFVNDVLHHVASQGTQHERSRFWVREAHVEPYLAQDPVVAAPFLTRPPADTLVLLGYVRGKEHLKWIHDHHVYNVRAGERTGALDLLSRELAAEFILLYGSGVDGVELWRVEGKPEIWTGTRMNAEKYPRKRYPGDLYFCFRLGDQALEALAMPSVARVNALRQLLRPETTSRPPVAVTWLELMS